MMDKVNLAEKFAQVHEYWSPRIIGDVQNMHVKIARLRGSFVWHQHAAEDELFLVLNGRLLIQVKESDAVTRDIWLDKGELLIIPRGMEHRPVAEEEVQVMLFEPAGTLNTGNVRSEHTVDMPDRI
jgi:mannose-6-phosphate isomerase-like protein (cupin superfamily)